MRPWRVIRRSAFCSATNSTKRIRDLCMLPVEEQQKIAEALMKNVHHVELATASAAPTQQQLRVLFVACAVPMVGFGFVDNAIMLLAGEFIELELGSAFHISTLAAAGFGNLISDVFGLGFGGVIEAAAGFLGLQMPNLSAAQMAMASTRFVRHSASVLGISIGCILGMFPLFFYDEDEVGLRQIFNMYDHDRNGVLDKQEGNYALVWNTMSQGHSFTCFQQSTMHSWKPRC